jgi:hypothetical protein
MGLIEIFWSGDPEGEKWQAAFKQIAEVRKRCMDAKENPGVRGMSIIYTTDNCANQIFKILYLYVAGQKHQFWLIRRTKNQISG